MSIITISRGTYSGGKAVAEALGSKLGYPCISKEIIFDAAEEFGIPEEKITASLMEPPKSWKLKPSRRIAHLNFVRFALLKAVKDGNIVYHGFAGHLLFGSALPILRVRVISNMEDRIQSAMDEDQSTRKQAISRITKMDKQISKWVRVLYDMEWQHPSLYDLVINLEHFSIDGAVEMIEKMTQIDDFKNTEAFQETFNNQFLCSLVWAALTKDQVTSSADVSVSASDGNVTIAGNVGSENILEAIESIANTVEGVKNVINKVEIGSDWY